LARVAAQIADASRSRMLSYLLDGEHASASELARAAGVSAATASGHLAQLLDAGFLVCEPRGRHRYYRLADGEIAQALTALALVAERGSHARSWASPQRQRLRQARCCWGHLAGALGVQLLQAMLQQGWLQADGDDFRVTDGGRSGLAALGMAPDVWQGPTSSRGRLAYACLDWSERRDHLAGRLGRALLQHALDQGWLRRHAGERALDLTPRGRSALAGLLLMS
jgi:DNA-binding transcriptional ArsR family regulator